MVYEIENENVVIKAHENELLGVISRIKGCFAKKSAKITNKKLSNNLLYSSYKT